MFQFSLELNFVKIACRRRRSVPTKQHLPRRWFTDSQFLTISSERASKGRVGARCAFSCPGPEQMCPGFGPSSLWLCHSHPQQPQCGRTLSFGEKNQPSQKDGSEIWAPGCSTNPINLRGCCSSIQCSQGRRVLLALLNISS